MHSFIAAYEQAQRGYLRLEERNRVLIGERATIEALHKAEIEDKNAAIAAKELSIEALNKSLEEVGGAVTKQREELRSARAEAAQLQREKDAWIQEKASWEQERSQAQEEAASLRKSLETTMGELNKLSSNLAAAKDAARTEVLENLEDYPEFRAKVFEGIQDTSFPVLNEILDALIAKIPLTDPLAVRDLPHVGAVFHYRDSEYTSVEEYLTALRAGAFDEDEEEDEVEDDAEAEDSGGSEPEKEAEGGDVLEPPADSGKRYRHNSPDFDNVFKGLTDLPEGSSSGAGGHSQGFPDATQRGTPDAFQSDLADPSSGAPVDPGQPSIGDPSFDPGSTSLSSGPSAPVTDPASLPADQSVPSPAGRTASPSADQRTPPPATLPIPSPVLPASAAPDISDPCAGIPDLSAPRRKPAP